jgi:uncharacterized membrane protein
MIFILGLVSFLIGYFFLGKVQGQNECAEKPASTTINYNGGIAGVVIGVIFIVVGVFIGMATAQPVQYSSSN